MYNDGWRSSMNDDDKRTWFIQNACSSIFLHETNKFGDEQISSIVNEEQMFMETPHPWGACYKHCYEISYFIMINSKALNIVIKAMLGSLSEICNEWSCM